MRIDQLTLRAAGGALLLLSLLVVVASPGDVLDRPVGAVLAGDLGALVRVVLAAAGLSLVLSLQSLAPSLHPGRGSGRPRRAVPVLLGLHALALVALAFTSPSTEPVGADAVAAQATASSALGDLALLVASTTLPAAMIVQAARWRRDETTAPRAKGAFVAAVVSLWASLAYSLADQGTLPAPGLWQRVAFVVAWAWLAVLLLRTAGDLTSGSADTRR
ncbi:MAG: DUF998 domain-containing protein [Aeromicrobium erythreum]